MSGDGAAGAKRPKVQASRHVRHWILSEKRAKFVALLFWSNLAMASSSGIMPPKNIWITSIRRDIPIFIWAAAWGISLFQIPTASTSRHLMLLGRLLWKVLAIRTALKWTRITWRPVPSRLLAKRWTRLLRAM